VCHGQVVLERACQAAAERADNDFRQLLQQAREAGSVTAVSTWVAAKPSVSAQRIQAGCRCSKRNVLRRWCSTPDMIFHSMYVLGCCADLAGLCAALCCTHYNAASETAAAAAAVLL
jgi:hypothetical protein